MSDTFPTSAIESEPSGGVAREAPAHPDANLWMQVCRNDPTAVEELLNHRCGPLLDYLARHHGWNDLRGEVYLHLREGDWRRLRTWQGRSTLKTWVQTVALRMCYRRMKDDARFVTLEEHHVFRASMNRKPDQENIFDRSDALKCISKLQSPQERRFMTLHVIQGLAIEEVVRLMGITRTNADVIHHRAKAHMKEWLAMEGRRHG
ncbi:MAG TPA: sigma-70 family RNA polymerase sigma factor [Fibrobacteria bacterium]|nr:sigma-70 family RNA polymerase sigma factor [Fibrobacteria bacterium]